MCECVWVWVCVCLCLGVYVCKHREATLLSEASISSPLPISTELFAVCIVSLSCGASEGRAKGIVSVHLLTKGFCDMIHRLR